MISNTPYARHGILVRIFYLAISVTYALIRRLWSRRGTTDIVVLCYHGIKPHQAARFAWQIRRAAGRTIKPRDLTIPRICGRSLPAVCFTFDDGYANLIDNALPIMCKHDVPACIFAVTDNMGERPRWQIKPEHPDAGEPLMTAAQLHQAVRQYMCALGSHTCTHPSLAEIPLSIAIRELEESRRMLSTITEQPVEDLALPHGSFTATVLQAAQDAGYQRIYTLEPTLHNTANGRHVIGRFLMSPDAWRIEFLLTCEGAYRWLYPWRRLLRRLHGRVAHAANPETVSA